MTRFRSLVIVCFLLAFAAGLGAGLSLRRPATHEGRSSWLVRELNLTPAQQKQMEAIWAHVHDGGRASSDQRRELMQQRDRAIRNLIPAADQPKLDALLADSARKLDALSAQRRTAFTAAVQKTKQILSPEQRSKYEQLLARWSDGHHPGPPRPPRDHRSPAEAHHPTP